MSLPMSPAGAAEAISVRAIMEARADPRFFRIGFLLGSLASVVVVGLDLPALLNQPLAAEEQGDHQPGDEAADVGEVGDAAALQHLSAAEPARVEELEERPESDHDVGRHRGDRADEDYRYNGQDLC